MKKAKQLTAFAVAAALLISAAGCSPSGKKEDESDIKEKDVIKLAEDFGEGLIGRNYHDLEDLSIDYEMPDIVYSVEYDGDSYKVYEAWHKTFEVEVDEDSIEIDDDSAEVSINIIYMDMDAISVDDKSVDGWLDAMEDADETASTELKLKMELDDDDLKVKNTQKVVDAFEDISYSLDIQNFDYEDLVKLEVTSGAANEEAVVTISCGDEDSLEGTEISIRIEDPDGNNISDAMVYFYSNSKSTITLDPEFCGNSEGLFEEDYYYVYVEINGTTITESFLPTAPVVPDTQGPSDNESFLMILAEEGFVGADEARGTFDESTGIYTNEYFGFEIALADPYAYLSDAMQLSSETGLENGLDFIIYDMDNPVDELGMYNIGLVLIFKVDDLDSKLENYYGNSKVKVAGFDMYYEVYVDDSSSQTLYCMAKDDCLVVFGFMGKTDMPEKVMEEMLKSI